MGRASLPSNLQPMLASLADAPLDDPRLVYEPKYDGIRAVVEVDGRTATRGSAGTPRVRIWSRLGHEKTAQFPEVAAALERWARRRSAPVVLDGEIVALGPSGAPAGFQQLQNHSPGSGRVAFIAFDILREGAADVRARPLVERRRALERVFGATKSPALRISEMVAGDGRALHTRAVAEGWEGLIAKRADSRYQSGKRTADWRKLKILQEQEFVVGGWTEPRHTRSHFGALLVGVSPTKGRRTTPSPLVYAGHIGTGFNEKELARVMARLKGLETSTCPFSPTPTTNERPHWVRPELVAQVRFTEWTADGKLRHPVYLGLRDDKRPSEVVREGSGFKVQGSGFGGQGSDALLDELRELENKRRDGVITLPNGDALAVTNLSKVFWPKQKLTKGDLFRYYVRAESFILPAVANRPLVMKRFPNGVAGQPFYQHRALHVPTGVRVETVDTDADGADGRPLLVGGNLTTLLYMTQIAAISQDPWFSRVGSVASADYVALDLDPPAGVPFARVLDVARCIHDELDSLGVVGFPKTSGADGIHIYIPLPPHTPYEAGRLFCQIVATVVTQKHPAIATVERRVGARGRRIYIDCLQNIPGKTLATAYSARASAYAGVSAPLTWEEVHEGVSREDFTLTTMPARLKEKGDLWKGLRQAKGADLRRASRYAARADSV